VEAQYAAASSVGMLPLGYHGDGTWRNAHRSTSHGVCTHAPSGAPRVALSTFRSLDCNSDWRTPRAPNSPFEVP
jgi:hypothetical protein